MAVQHDNERTKLIAAGVGLAASIALAAWLLGFFENDDNLSADPEVAELQREIGEFRNQEERPEPTDDMRNAFRQRMEQLTPQQREEFFLSMMQTFAPMMEKRLSDFFALTEDEQRAQIDREIDAMQSMGRQGAGGRAPFGGGRPGGNVDPQRMQSMMKRMNAHTSPEMRAMMDTRMRMMNNRLAERGLEPMGFGR
jgi:hypothetical protein